MSYAVTEHIPGYADGCEPRRAAVESIDELLALPWVRWWERGNIRIVNDAAVAPVFVGWRRSDNALLALYHEDESEWHVVAYAPRELLASLPTWAISPKGQEKVDRWNRGDVSA